MFYCGSNMTKAKAHQIAWYAGMRRSNKLSWKAKEYLLRFSNEAEFGDFLDSDHLDFVLGGTKLDLLDAVIYLGVQ